MENTTEFRAKTGNYCAVGSLGKGLGRRDYELKNDLETPEKAAKVGNLLLKTWSWVVIYDQNGQIVVSRFKGGTFDPSEIPVLE